MNTTAKIGLAIGSQLATMIAAAAVLIAVAEGVSWWCVFADRKGR
jgi:hypothetical protein